MRKHFHKIMLVTNEPCETAGAEQTTLNLAKVNHAEVLLVDSIRTPFNVAEHGQMMPASVYDVALGAKRHYLEQLQAQFEQQGVRTEFEILLGSRTSTELIDLAVSQGCDLVIRYMKGQSSVAAGRFGETAKNLLRACPCPVLLTGRNISDPKVVACINLDHGAEENQSILDNARRIASSSKNLSIVSCWEFSSRDFMNDYVDQGIMEQTSSETADLYRKLFEQLQNDYDLDDVGSNVFLFNENPVSAIPRFCKENRIDIAVMCSASLNHPLGRRLGSTIERTIADLPCALMSVKPIGFWPPRDGSTGKQMAREAAS